MCHRPPQQAVIIIMTVPLLVLPLHRHFHRPHPQLRMVGIMTSIISIMEVEIIIMREEPRQLRRTAVVEDTKAPHVGVDFVGTVHTANRLLLDVQCLQLGRHRADPLHHRRPITTIMLDGIIGPRDIQILLRLLLFQTPVITMAVVVAADIILRINNNADPVMVIMIVHRAYKPFGSGHTGQPVPSDGGYRGGTGAETSTGYDPSGGRGPPPRYGRGANSSGGGGIRRHDGYYPPTTTAGGHYRSRSPLRGTAAAQQRNDGQRGGGGGGPNDYLGLSSPTRSPRQQAPAGYSPARGGGGGRSQRMSGGPPPPTATGMVGGSGAYGYRGAADATGGYGRGW